MSTVVVLNRIPSTVTPLGDWLGEISDQVVLITSPGSAPGYRGVFGRVVEADPYTDGEAVPTAVGKILAEGGTSALVHLIEDDVLRASRLRDAHGLPGLREAEALPFRDKYAMKQRVSAAGIRCPGFVVPDGSVDPAGLGERFGWPLVAKPRLGSGSAGVTVVRDAGALKARLAEMDPDDVMVEEYVPGAVFHIDGLMHEGRILASVASRYVNDCLAFHDARPLGSAQLDPDHPEAVELDAFAAAVVAALPSVDFSPFHLEVFRREGDGEPVFCEIACRVGGAHVMECTTYALGVNPARLHVRHQAGLEHGPAAVPTGPSGARYGWLLVPPREGRLESVRAPEDMPWLRDFFVKTEVPHTFGAARWSTDSYLGFVVEGPDHTTVTARLRACAEAVETLVTWSD